VTKKLPSLEEARKIFRNSHPFSPEFRELVRSGMGDEVEKADRMVAAIARVKAEHPGSNDEEACEIEARYPFSTKGWPKALSHWVEHQVKTKKNFTDEKRRNLLKLADFIRKNVAWLDDDVVATEDKDRVINLMKCTYLIGVHCPAPDEGLGKVTKALEKTKNRKPKWHAIADGLLLRTGLPPSDDGKAKKIHPGLVEILTAKEPKRRPPTVRTLRDYIGKVGKKRT
jgi:hypothetical protein